MNFLIFYLLWMSSAFARVWLRQGLVVAQILMKFASMSQHYYNVNIAQKITNSNIIEFFCSWNYHKFYQWLKFK